MQRRVAAWVLAVRPPSPAGPRLPRLAGPPGSALARLPLLRLGDPLPPSAGRGSTACQGYTEYYEQVCKKWLLISLQFLEMKIWYN